MARSSGWGDTLIGILVGGAVTVLVLAGINWAQGWHRLSAWQRALDERQAEQLEALMLSQVERAGRSLDDADPTALSARMAATVFPALYQHYLDHARYLLENDRVEAFNELRAGSVFAVLDLSGADLAGLDLEGANFAGAILDRVDLRRAHLDGATFFRSRLAGADLSEARVNATIFAEADLGGARLNGLMGDGADFSDAILVDAAMTGLEGLTGARLTGATLAQCNLHGSRFPGAELDGADLTMASAVGCDFSEVASMDAVLLTGANLSGASLRPETATRLWLYQAEGLDPSLVRALRAHGAVDRPEDLLSLVDARIVAGFEAQVDALPETTPETRRAMLLDLLRQFWMQ